MSKKYHKIQFSIILAMILVCVVGVVAAVLVQRTHDPDYWMAFAAAMIPLVLPVAGKIWRAGNVPSADYVDEQADNLREAVLEDWGPELEVKKLSSNPLPVPFAVATEVRCPVKVRKGRKGSTEDETKDTTVAVMAPWSSMLDGSCHWQPELTGTCDKIAEAVDDFRRSGLPNRLIVLGEPGAGKSILAQALTVELVKARAPGRGSGIGAVRAQPIPVLLQLATWDPAVPLNEWAAVQMARAYPWLAEETEAQRGTSRTLAAALIERGRVLMVLDGLDEVAAENRMAAFEKLSEAARGDQAMIVTCRTTEYAQIVYGAKHPMPKTPVIRLDPLPLDKVTAYLDGLDYRFGKLADQMAAEPDGAVAKALSSPLALYLVTNVYRDIDTDPDELTEPAKFGDAREIVKHLLNGLIPAVYATRATDGFQQRGELAVAAARQRLTRIAQYLGPKLDSKNIDWWRLPEQVPGWFLGCPIGLFVGCMLGAAVGLAAATRFTAHAGVPFGIGFGIVTGLLSGVTSARGQDHPRAMDLHFHWDYQRFVGCVTVGVAVGLTTAYADARHGGLIAGLVTAVVVGPACATPCVRVFGWKPGITAGAAAAIALGLSSGLSKGNGQPALSGLAVGVVFALAAWVFVGLFQPSKNKLEVNPRALLDRDRAGCLTVAVTAGVAFAVVFGVALGPLLGVVAFGSLTITVALTVSMWAAFNVSRIWLACTGMLPVQIMSFLHEAHCRGVLRQVGGSYQFRHAELKEALIEGAAAAEGSGP
jgi:hypothetical protein